MTDRTDTAQHTAGTAGASQPNTRSRQASHLSGDVSASVHHEPPHLAGLIPPLVASVGAAAAAAGWGGCEVRAKGVDKGAKGEAPTRDTTAALQSVSRESLADCACALCKEAAFKSRHTGARPTRLPAGWGCLWLSPQHQERGEGKGGEAEGCSSRLLDLRDDLRHNSRLHRGRRRENMQQGVSDTAWADLCGHPHTQAVLGGRAVFANQSSCAIAKLGGTTGLIQASSAALRRLVQPDGGN